MCCPCEKKFKEAKSQSSQATGLQSSSQNCFFFTVLSLTMKLACLSTVASLVSNFLQFFQDLKIDISFSWNALLEKNKVSRQDFFLHTNYKIQAVSELLEKLTQEEICFHCPTAILQDPRTRRQQSILRAFSYLSLVRVPGVIVTFNCFNLNWEIAGKLGLHTPGHVWENIRSGGLRTNQ